MKLAFWIAFISLFQVGIANTQIINAIPSVVSVLPVWTSATFNSQEPEGSGIVINDGMEILTASHVIKSAKSIRIRTNDGLILQAEVIWKDHDTDVALLKISEKLVPAEFVDGGGIGEKVCSIGNAFGLGISVSCGVISANQRTNVGFNALEDFIQTDAGMNPGKSGGALINADGEVIGMLSAIFTKKSDADIGINFAVSTRLINRLLKQKQKAGNSTWRENPINLASYPKAPNSGMMGAKIMDIKTPSQAYKDGFRTGDIIIRAGDRRIKEPSDFKTEFALYEHEHMPVTVVRDNKQLVLNWQFN